MATEPTEKAAILRTTHLPVNRDAHDLHPPHLAQDSPQWLLLTQKEVELALLRSNNSSPGEDEITTKAVRLAWPVLGDTIHRLYNACLTEGWHPSPFRSATLCTIEKPGKRDRSSPRSYRLIALLSVLGKGLERVIARRMAWNAVTNRILPAGYFGALPAQSASDLVTLLIDDIEKAFARKKSISIATFDVKGGFDTVLPNRLLHCLQDQKWPTHVICWVRSFLSKRKAALRIDGHTTEHFPLPGSLPQGSPVSPILFQLFLQPLFAARPAPDTFKRRGYADDGRITAHGPSPSTNCLVLEREFEDVAQWCQTNKIPLDLDKTSLIHFTRLTKDSNPPICLPSSATL